MQRLEEILSWKKAEDARRSGRLEEALALFTAEYEAAPSGAAGWRRLFCLRRLGRLAEAEALGAALAAIHPDDAQIGGELAWLVHETVVKPAKGAGDHAAMLAGARRMAELARGGVAFETAAFAAIEAAKSLSAWEEMLGWCDRIDPATLAAQPRVMNGRRLPSRREMWWFARCRALFQLEQFEECRRASLEAFKQFGHRLDFSRWAALSLERLGNRDAAIEEMQCLSRHRNAQWYYQQDLARMELAAGRPGEAWEHIRQGARMPGEAQAKVNLYAVGAEVLELLGRKEEAGGHALLAALLRQEQNWHLPGKLEELLFRLPVPVPTPSLAEIEKRCRAAWAGQDAVTPGRAVEGKAAPAEDAGEVLAEECRGTVRLKDEKAAFGFIRANDFDSLVFVLMKDLPESCRFDGSPVRFTAVRSFDAKKNREGVRAIAVTMAA
ncbi:MAG TPA: hypothetical protein PLP29_04750 [Candidatus Ozemobacteraceae bacterium]|nr:hypothetical protein [Candidatus Ozemobacteraceae bacterium]